MQDLISILCASLAGVLFYTFWINHELLLRNQRIAGRTPHRTKLLWVSSGALFGGIFFLLLAVLLLSDHLKTTGSSSQSSENFSLLLSVLGILLSVATVVVVTIARNAVEDIRRLKISIEKLNWTGEKENELNALQILRLQLIYENNNEYERARLDRNDGAMAFRSLLIPLYESASSQQLMEYLKYIDERYDAKRDGSLTILEKKYLERLANFYDKFGTTEGELDLAKLARAAENRWKWY